MEYLERLLADVERHKQLANNAVCMPSTGGKDAAGKVRQDGRPNVQESRGEDTSQVSAQSWQEDSPTDSIPASSTISDISKLQDKCVSELSCTLTSARRPKSEIPGNLEKSQIIRRNSDPDVPSNYVTVIEVTGSSKKGKNAQDEEEDDDENENEKGIFFFFCG